MNDTRRFTPARDGQRDFDFLFGNWRVAGRRLREPLGEREDWYECDGTSHERSLWDGRANIEELALSSAFGRIDGLALRLYDTSTRLWSIFWGTAANGLTLVPTVGAFDASGVGEFFNDETYRGKPIVCRFRWTREGGHACRWEQSFSADGGVTWQINWTMDFTRAA